MMEQFICSRGLGWPQQAEKIYTFPLLAEVTHPRMVYNSI